MCALLMAGFTMTFAQGLTLKPGQKLSFDVDYQGTKYQFLMNLKKIDNTIEYDWAMSSSTAMQGSVLMKNSSLKKGVALDNFFNAGEKKRLDSFTCGFISWLSFDTVNEKSKVKMDAGNGRGKMIFVKKPVPPGQEIILDGQALDVLYMESEDGKEKFWILNNPKTPLILKMDLGWTLAISKVE